MPHGTSCALALPYCIAYNQNLGPELASALALTITGGRSDDLHTAAQAILDLSKRLGLPTTLDEANIPEHTERSIAQRCVREYPRPTNPEPLEEEPLERLLSAMRTGDLGAAFEATAQTIPANR
jgi:alcohol dehydrogenase class IV